MVGGDGAGGRGEDRRDAEFTAFVEGSYRSLCRAAYLVVGDWHLAEDVVQGALVAIYRRWDRIEHQDGAGPYARRAVVNAAVSELRRPHRRRERVRETLPEDGGGLDPGELRPDDAVLDALRALPPKQRAVIVLRYVEDVDIATTAAALGISEGTVKSQSSKALGSLRRHLSDVPDLRPTASARSVSAPTAAAPTASARSVSAPTASTPTTSTPAPTPSARRSATPTTRKASS